MLVVFILLGIIAIPFVILILIILSTLRIEIKALEADNYIQKEKILKGYMIYLHMYLFNKIKWFGMRLDEKKCCKIKEGSIVKVIDKKMGIKQGEEVEKFKEILVQNRKEIFSTKSIKKLRELNIDISKIDFSLAIGTESVILTSFIVSFISSVISIVLANKVSYLDKEKYKYIVNPLYFNKNIFKIKLNCIINVKMVHIINMLYLLLKKRSDKSNGGTSNRRAYDYSHE